MSLFTKQFYHTTIKSYIIAFGKLFSDIHISRYDGEQLRRVEVPITFSNKEKFVQRLLQDPKLDRQAAIQLPRMAFEMVSMNYDGQRKLNKNKKIVQFNDQGRVTKTAYTPVPYDFIFQIYITTKTEDEMLQIVEQIVPAFTPDYVIKVKATNTDLHLDIPITLDSVQPTDTYDGEFETRRVILWTMSFVFKGALFSPIKGGPSASSLPELIAIPADSTLTRFDGSTINLPEATIIKEGVIVLPNCQSIVLLPGDYIVSSGGTIIYVFGGVGTDGSGGPGGTGSDREFPVIRSVTVDLKSDTASDRLSFIPILPGVNLLEIKKGDNWILQTNIEEIFP